MAKKDTIDTTDIIEVYKTILENETSNHTVSIYILLGMLAILLGATWWWNKTGASKRIKKEVKNIFKKERQKFNKKSEEEINEKIDLKIKDYEKNVLIIEADVARSMAISASDNKHYSHSAYWWAKFVKKCIEANNSYGIRTGAEWLIKDLNRLKEGDKEGEIQAVHQCDFIKKTASELPELLDKERIEILKICKGRGEKE